MILLLFIYRVTWLVVKTDTFFCSKDSLVRVQNTANTESDTANTESDTANTRSGTANTEV